MPCDCSHMEPSEHEKESKHVAKLIVWLRNYVFKQELPPWIPAAAGSTYGNISKIHELTDFLCDLCRRLDKMNDAKDATAVELATWWIAHKQADKEKQKRLEKEKQDNVIKQRALRKLTDEDKRVLGL